MKAKRNIRRPIRRLVILLAVVLLAVAAARLRPLLLVWGVEMDRAPVVRLALALGVSPDAVKTGSLRDLVYDVEGSHRADGIGRPLLVEAAFWRDPVVVRLLLDAGADPNWRGDGALTPLIAAVLGGDHECVRLLLLHGADPNGHYKDNSTVLDNVPSPANPVIVAMLRQAGARG